MTRETEHGVESSGTRERLVAATVALIQEKGPSASGTAEILATARAPRGSFYHHFPGGKDELIATAVEAAGTTTLTTLQTHLKDRSATLEDRVEALLLAIADDQVAHDFRFGCAVGATTLETACTPGGVRDAAQAAFASWTGLLTDALRAELADPEDAAALADTIVAVMEGATMLTRARSDSTPLLRAAAMARRLVAASAGRPI